MSFYVVISKTKLKHILDVVEAVAEVLQLEVDHDAPVDLDVLRQAVLELKKLDDYIHSIRSDMIKEILHQGTK